MKTTFTKEQVIVLNQQQKRKDIHPFTCDRKAKECEVYIEPRDYSKDGVLIATEQGWICPCGRYKQNWMNSETGK